jgi:flagellar protein FliS
MKPLAAQAHIHYQRTQVETASPGKLIVMLYDGAIRKLNQAGVFLAEGQRDEFHAQVVRVQKILTELMAALDHEKGGEVANNLSRIYDYMIRQLGLGLLNGETGNLDEVRCLLEELREGWVGALESVAEREIPSARDAFMALAAGSADSAPLAMPAMAGGLNIAG